MKPYFIIICTSCKVLECGWLNFHSCILHSHINAKNYGNFESKFPRFEDPTYFFLLFCKHFFH